MVFVVDQRRCADAGVDCPVQRLTVSRLYIDAQLCRKPPQRPADRRHDDPRQVVGKDGLDDVLDGIIHSLSFQDEIGDDHRDQRQSASKNGKARSKPKEDTPAAAG